MAKTLGRRAFTLTELLVVTAAIALLVTVLLAAVEPDLEKHKQAVCLANLKQIAVASHLYAAEDEREQLVPFHRMMVSTLHGQGFGGTEWCWRTAMPFTVGGRTPITPMLTETGPVTVMLDESQGGNGLWTERTRPLNPYLDGSGGLHGDERRGAAVFHCPADTGYPDNDWIQDAPRESADIPCYDFLGSSYRINTTGLVWLGGALNIGSFTSGPWGHTASSLEGPLSDAVLYCEPLFYNYSRQEPGYPPPPYPSWHGELSVDNVAYCDGSVRATKMGGLRVFTQQELHEMGYTPNFPFMYFLRRGQTWRMDVYPTPGSLIRMFSPDGQCQTPDPEQLGYIGWPFDDYQFNLPPE